MKNKYILLQLSFLICVFSFDYATAENSVSSQHIEEHIAKENITLEQLIDSLKLAHEHYLGDIREKDYNKAKVNYLFVAEQERTGISRDALDIIKSAQNCLGWMYIFGKGCEINRIQGDMWLTIATHSSNNKELSKQMVSSCEAQMTKEEITKAKELANEWLQAHQLL